MASEQAPSPDFEIPVERAPRILIIGAGFAGLNAARTLAGKYRATVIDPAPNFEFTPNIHELVSGHKKPSELILDRETLLAGMGHEWLRDRVTAIDPVGKKVSLESGKALEYGYAILALGGVNDDHEVPGMEAHAMPFKSVRDCQLIGDRLAELNRSGKNHKVTIVGAGVEGLESLGEILRKYHRSKRLELTVVEAGAQFLPGTTDKLDKEVRRLCEAWQVRFRFETRVVEVKENAVVLSGGEQLDSDLTIWTGGVKLHPLVREAGLADETDEWAQVTEYLESKPASEMFIAGDSAGFAVDGDKQAYLAQEMGKVAAENLLNKMEAKELKPFKAPEYPSVYSFGNLSCFVLWKGRLVAGLPFSGLKETIFQFNMAKIQGKQVCEDWDRNINRVIKGGFDIVITGLSSPLNFWQRSAIRIL